MTLRNLARKMSLFSFRKSLSLTPPPYSDDEFSVVITVISIPIFALSITTLAWLGSLSSSNRDAVKAVLGSQNFIAAGACGISGSVNWVIGGRCVPCGVLPVLMNEFSYVAVQDLVSSWGRIFVFTDCSSDVDRRYGRITLECRSDKKFVLGRLSNSALVPRDEAITVFRVGP